MERTLFDAVRTSAGFHVSLTPPRSGTASNPKVPVVAAAEEGFFAVAVTGGAVIRNPRHGRAPLPIAIPATAAARTPPQRRGLRHGLLSAPCPPAWPMSSHSPGGRTML